MATIQIQIGGKKRPVSFGIGTLRRVKKFDAQNPIAMLSDVTYQGLIQADKSGELPAKFDQDMSDEWLDELTPEAAKTLYENFEKSLNSPLFQAMNP